MHSLNGLVSVSDWIRVHLLHLGCTSYIGGCQTGLDCYIDRCCAGLGLLHWWVSLSDWIRVYLLHTCLWLTGC